MEYNLQAFSHKMFGNLQVLINNGKEYFPAKEVAEALGYKNQSDAILKHCRKEGILAISQNTIEGNSYQKKFINEGNLYRLIVKSRLPEAEKFEQWVFEEVLPTVRKTGGYVSNADLMVNTYFGALPNEHKMMIKGLFVNIEEQQKQLVAKQKEIEYKENVIIGLVDEITLSEKRQILVRVVKKGGTKYAERWNALYREFENKYHINLKIRLNTYNEDHKPKLKNKLDYIDKVMGKLPELYEIACKLYENDVKQLVEEMYELNRKVQ